MNTPAPAPKPKRSRRMVVWMVAMPIAILLLSLAGANWKTFHLAYCKHLISSDDLTKQRRGVAMVLRTHLREGMPLEEVRSMLAPARLTEKIRGRGPRADGRRAFDVRTGRRSLNYICPLTFDKDDRLVDHESRGAGR